MLLIIVVFVFISAKAQDSLDRAWIGADFAMGNNAIGRANILPGITWSNNKHLVFAGPALIYGIEYNPYPPAYGFQCGYQFFPNGKRNRFNLFFEYDMSYIKKQYKFGMHTSYPQALFKRSVVVSSFDNYLSFGFRVNLNRAFYFHTNVGLGIVLYKENTSDEFNNGAINNRTYCTVSVWKFFPFNSLYGGYDEIYYYPNQGRLIGIFKAGIGMNICSFKKK